MEDKRDLALLEKLRDMEDADFGRIQQASTLFPIIGIIAAVALIMFFINFIWFSPSAEKPAFLTFLPLFLAMMFFNHSRSLAGLVRIRRIVRHLARKSEGVQESA